MLPLRTSRASVRICLALLALPIAGCGEGPTGTAPLTIAITGLAERGAEVELSALSNAARLPSGSVEWSVSPASAAQLTSDSTARLLSAGETTFTARAGGRSASLVVTVALPPTVVFDRAAAGNRDIWRVALDGGELTRLTTDPSDDSDPSAVGGTIVFVSYRNGNGDLYALQADGSERRLTSTARNEGSPALSREGGRIAYTYDVSGVTKLWMSSLEGAAPGPVAPTLNALNDIHASPSWGPGPDELAFVSTLGGSADILAAPVPGGSPRPLVTGPYADVEPAWSPDGTRIAFASNRDGDTEIYLLTLASGAVTRLTHRPGSDAQPAWLPDGRLVYTATEGGTTSLRWLDPARPELSYEIPGAGPGAAHPSGVL